MAGRGGDPGNEVATWPGSNHSAVVASFTCINPLRPNNDLSQTSHYNIKGVSVSEVMRIEKMITQVHCY